MVNDLTYCAMPRPQHLHARQEVKSARSELE